MELLAVIIALEKLNTPQDNVHIYTDSKYVSDAINQNWIFGWIKRFQKVKNDDLWRRFIPLMRTHKLQFHWIKGHAGHPENERCDQLAVKLLNLNNYLLMLFLNSYKIRKFILY